MALKSGFRAQFQSATATIFDLVMQSGADEGYIRKGTYHPITGLSQVGTVETVRVFLDETQTEPILQDGELVGESVTAIVLQSDLLAVPDGKPTVGSEIAANDSRWVIRAISQDPAGATWVLQLEKR